MSQLIDRDILQSPLMLDGAAVGARRLDAGQMRPGACDACTHGTTSSVVAARWRGAPPSASAAHRAITRVSTDAANAQARRRQPAAERQRRRALRGVLVHGHDAGRRRCERIGRRLREGQADRRRHAGQRANGRFGSRRRQRRARHLRGWPLRDVRLGRAAGRLTTPTRAPTSSCTIARPAAPSASAWRPTAPRPTPSAPPRGSAATGATSCSNRSPPTSSPATPTSCATSSSVTVQNARRRRGSASPPRSARRPRLVLAEHQRRRHPRRLPVRRHHARRHSGSADCEPPCSPARACSSARCSTRRRPGWRSRSRFQACPASIAAGAIA